ncbi:FAD-dependent oxidoreductase [Candidatus Saccharibacteria bacterium]|nr:FAD-dependent oxidoreductase [Candidatus Saccharibacteria bacterium]
MTKDFDIIIVGAGPAGLTAALYALRAGKKVLILEGKAVGGQIITTEKIKNYPAILEISGTDFARNLKGQVESYGRLIKLEQVVSIEHTTGSADHSNLTAWLVTTDMDTAYSAPAVILATGSAPRHLGLKNESRLAGHGVSYCATCDGNFYQDKIVAVVGGGNTALYDALYLADIAKKVYLIHRRDEFRGDKALVSQLENKQNVEFVLSARIAELVGDSHLTKIVIEDTTSKTVRTIDVDALFVAIGRAPQNEPFKDIIKLDADGYIETADGVRTSADRIYVAGDARKKSLNQLTTAVSDGAIAATTAIQEL